ncbi:MAG TPA: hypothetical protein VF719_03020 [Abditibacteriaceae bacterium]
MVQWIRHASQRAHSARRGTTTALSDRRNPGSTWVCLGTYSFKAGTSGSVLLRTTDTTNFVLADAVPWVKMI